MDILEKNYPDASEEVWELVYKKAYKNKIIGEKFYIDKPYCSNGRFNAKNKEDPDVTISGETDFNFGNGLVVHGKTKYDYYREILETIADEDKKKKCMDLLKYCREMTEKVGNYSLMQSTGALQMVKGNFTSTDRIDTFLYILNNYYTKRDELVLNRCTSAQIVEKLKKYLDLFCITEEPSKSIFKYCSEVYHISNEKLVRDMIESGKHSISNVERLIDYMILANRFWTEKSNYYKKVGISNKWKLKLIIRTEYL